MTNEECLKSEVKQFVEVSSVLTGFSVSDLYNTGQSIAYFNWIKHKAEHSLSALLKTMQTAPASRPDLDHYIQTHLMEDEGLEALVNSIMKLWYLGHWEDPSDKSRQTIPEANCDQSGLLREVIKTTPKSTTPHDSTATLISPSTLMPESIGL